MHEVMFERGIGMKKLTKKSRILSLIASGVLVIIILAAVKYAVILLVLWRNPIGLYKENNQRPNDKLSRSVKEVVGDDFYYQGKEEQDSGVTEYEYLIKKQNEEAVAHLLSALNDAIKNEQGKIRVSVWAKMSVNGLERVFVLENFSDVGLGEADYDGMYAIWIGEPDMVEEECFSDPLFYTGIEGIRKLYIAPQMRTRAEKEEIDWYEIWPDLEEVEVAGWYED